MQTELSGKVGNRFGTQYARIVLSPSVLVFEILLQASKSVVNPAVQNHLASPNGQPFRGEFTEQSNWVVIQLSPTDRIDVAKKAVHFGLPAPPQISS